MPLSWMAMVGGVKKKEKVETLDILKGRDSKKNCKVQ